MADNDEAGGSRACHDGVGEELENYYLKFLVSQTPEQVPVDQGGDAQSRPHENHEEEMGDDEYDPDEDMSDADDHTDTGVAGTDGTSGSAAKRQRKPRRQNVVGTGRLVSSKIDEVSGTPLEPEEYAKGFDINCAAIAGAICSINDGELRKRKSTEPLEKQLIQKVHSRYKFPEPYNDLDIKNNIANTCALSKICRGLSSWKYRVRKMVDKGCSSEEIRNTYPQISVANLTTFKDAMATPGMKKKREWGKEMRDKNLGVHTLGTRGYDGKQPVWDKEDAQRVGENPWHKFKDPLARRTIRARYLIDKDTGELKTGKKVLDLEKKYLAEEKAEAESTQTSSQGSTKKLAWDTPFVRAYNQVKERPVTERPHGGRVVGAGDMGIHLGYPIMRVPGARGD